MKYPWQLWVIVPIAGLGAALALWDSRKDSPEDVIVPAAEIQAAKSWVTTELMEEIDCSRPVLHGEPIAANGTDSLRRLFATHGPMARCIASVRVDGEDDFNLRASWTETGGERRQWIWNLPGIYAPMRTLPPVYTEWDGIGPIQNPPLPVGSESDYVRAVVRECASLAAELSSVVRHTAVCAPWGASRGPTTGDDPQNAYKLGVAAELLVRRAVAAGENERAFRILFDAVRMAHDLRRGRPDILLAMLATTIEKRLWSVAQTILVPDLGLDASFVTNLRNELDLLEDSRPPLRSMMMGELLEQAAYSALPRADEEFRPPAPIPVDWIPALSPFPQLPDRTFGWALLVATHRARASLDVTCAAPVSDLQCWIQLTELRSTLPDIGPFGALTEDIDWELVSGARHASSLDILLRYGYRALFLAVAVPGYRLLLEAHVHRDDDDCSSADMLDSALSTEPTLGGALRIIELNDTMYEIHAPSAFAPDSDGRPSLPLFTGVCPRRSLAEAGRWGDLRHHDSSSH